MSEYTPNLNLFKYNPSTDGKEIFSINQALNYNWDILDNLGSGRNIGEIVASTIPLTDAGLHLLDGSLIQGDGIYSDFVDYIASIYDVTANYFCTEAQWQTSVTSYGVCGKFVYDSVNNTVRLPKYSNKIYTQELDNTAPVVGNGMTLGLTDGTNYAGLRGNFNLTRNALDFSASGYGKNVGDSDNQTGTGLVDDKIYGLTTDPTKSGLVAQLSNITTSLDGYYYIVIATSTKTDIQVDIDEVVTDLNGKADVDLSNINPTQNVKNTIVNWGMPDYTAGILVSTSTYTAPSNGIIGFYQNGEVNNELSFTINGSKVVRKTYGGYSGMGFSGEVLVSANDSIDIQYASYMTVTFYPLKGAS